jgi:membrane associated rhomboid family serine protease
VRGRIDSSQLRITRGALILLFLQGGLSLVWLLADAATRAALSTWLSPSPSTVWEQGKVWTLFTGPLLEVRFMSLLLQSMVLWLFVPALERFWGTARFLRFAALTSVGGTIAGTLAGVLTGHDVAMAGLDPFIYASIVAFGIIYARQPVQFFGVLPMTGRQLMLGILAFLALFVLLQGLWEEGAAFAAAIGLTLLITSQRYSPELLWQRWRRKLRRSHLSVVPDAPRKKPERWLN